MSSSTSPSFTTHLPRPPTPPRDRTITQGVDDALRFLEEGHQSPTKEPRDSTPRVILGTPPSHSPTTSLQGSGTGKKVDFSPWPIYHNPPQHTSLRPHITKQAPYSRPESKPLKSILKLANTPSPLTPDDIDNRLGYFSKSPESFEKMLQSVLHQLASPNRSARLDAYIALNCSLKAYEGMPDPQAMIAHMSFLTQFLSRDMVWKDTKGTLDTNIVSQSLQLACAILFNPQTSQALDDDFRAFLIDRSIYILEQPDVSKNIVKTHLYLLSHQRVYTGMLNAHRTEKILNAMKTLEERCSGNSAVAARLIIYQRLIEQAAVVMLNKMVDWIENLLHGLLSSNKDIRIRAIDACSKAGSVLGTHQQASKTLHQVLETEVEEGQTFGDFFNARLLNMISVPEVGPDVPRIWASIILLFRCKRRPVHKWPKFKEWLLTIQKCFNSSDLAIKQQASLAWNRLVFAVMPDSTTTEVCRSMLKVPILTSLEKTGLDKQSQQIRQFALDSYFNLLHYALRPGLPYLELDMAWDMYVQPVIIAIFKSSTKGPQQACRILSGLLNKTNGVWNINAVMEVEAIKPEDLPRLEIRWVRSRLRRIINVFEPILNLALQSSTKIPFFDDAWAALWQAVADAGSQEVRTSNELKDALAEITNLFGRVWRTGLKLHGEANAAHWSQKFHDYLRITVETLGSGPFVEDILSKTTDDEVEAAPTPSNRPSKGRSNTHSSLIFLFSLYYQPPPGVKADKPYCNSASWLIQFLTAAKVSAVDGLHVLTEVIQHCPQLYANNVPVGIAQQLWAITANKAVDLLSSLNHITYHEIHGVSIAIRHAMSIMTKGLQLSALDEENLQAILDLFEAMYDAAHRHGSDGAVISAVIQPLTVFLKTNMDVIRTTVTSQLIARVLQRSIWPKDRSVLEHAHKASGALPEPTRLAAAEHFNNFLSLVSETSRGLYDCCLPDTRHVSPAFLTSLADFLCECPASLLSHAMLQMQSGLAIWFHDPSRQIFPVPGPTFSTTADRLSRQAALDASRHMIPLWSKILNTIAGISAFDSDVLRSVDLLMIGGLSSPSRTIVNDTIKFWDGTFGAQTTLEYPERLLPVLRARMNQTDMSVPCLPNREEDEPSVTLPTFDDSLLGESELSPPGSATMKPRNRSLFVGRHASPNEDSVRPTSDAPVKKPVSRLRHDDSQIDFEPITSSPCPYEATSQLLTEHQKDVRDEQQANAQLFPDLSSSPNHPSAFLVGSIPKTLNFSDNFDHGIEVTAETPIGPAEGNSMSDDLPSSPTPRATNGLAAKNETKDLEIDPPSSPPETTEGGWGIRRGPLFGQAKTSLRVDADAWEVSTGAVDISMSEISTDSNSGVEQQETIAITEGHSAVPSHVKMPDELVNVDAITKDAAQKMFDEVNSTRDNLASSQEVDDSEKGGRGDSQNSKRGRRKRKRTLGPNVTDENSTQVSEPPSVPQASEPDAELDDADDEIVVAPREVSALAAHPVDEAAQVASPPAQRRSSKKRKSDVSQTSKAPPSLDGKYERSTPVLNNAGSSKRSAPIADADGPASFKVRRQQKTQDVKMTEQSQHQVQTRQGTKRQLAAVVIPDGEAMRDHARMRTQNNGEGSEVEAEDVDDSDAIDPDTQLTQEHSIAVHGRPIAQPHSIIARLRGVLADCKKMIFGSQEERDLDDVLFELRREVHEAGRRGRDL